MYKPRRYPQRRRKIAVLNIPDIQPSVDKKLKSIFATIGVPAEEPFKPDTFQLEALSIIEKSDCLVTAPTGSGKTWIAEQAIKLICKNKGRSWYTSPLKALTNSKYAEFSAVFGSENVGILTGDRKENPEAPIIVGTTEILRNQLYDAMHRGEYLKADFVILDEAHYLGDEDRGVVWEEVMIYLPQRIPLLMLSATIGNADQIAAWLSKIRERECVVVSETQRPVPLYPIFFHPSGKLLPLVVENKNHKVGLYKKVREYLDAKKPTVLAAGNQLPPFGEILDVFEAYNLLPAIFFLKSRADCDNAIMRCAETRSPHLNEDRSEKLRRLSAQSPHIASHRQLKYLEHMGVASHHSGQLPVWKLTVETLMTQGLLDAVFATSTVAAGVNFPARTVVFLNSDRFNGIDFEPLSPTEFHQMTGRAGRRGMDHIGFAVAIPGKHMDIRLIAKLIGSSPSPVLSQIRINFSMVLNLLLSHTPAEVESLLERSFATWLVSRQKKGKDFKNFLFDDFLNHLYLLMETGYVNEDGRLTEDGVWASQLRVDQPLLIAEGFRNGFFPEDPALLAAIMAAFVNEKEADDRIERGRMPKRLLNTMLGVKKGLREFVQHMLRRGFNVRPLYLKPALTIYEWASGMSWEDVIKIADMAEGDLAMLILRTADNLRHIQGLSRVFPKAADAADKSITLILRDPVKTLFE